MKTLIAIPCMDMVHAMFLRSVLGLRLAGTVEYSLACGSLVYDARNQLAYKAVNEGFDEDLSFCLRVAELGVPMFCDSGIKAGHLGIHEFTEADYLK